MSAASAAKPVRNVVWNACGVEILKINLSSQAYWRACRRVQEYSTDSISVRARPPHVVLALDILAGQDKISL